MTPRLRFSLSELSGALGDLGTFVPLLLGLVRTIGLDLGSTLIATGIYNVVTGIQFGIPMPVQPMKTIAAVVLSETNLNIPEVMSAGLTVSGIVFLLGITRGMKLFHKLVPFCLVRGIQLGVGIKLAAQGLKMVFYHPNSADWREYTGPEGLILGFFGLLFILLTTLPKRESPQEQRDKDNAARQWLLSQSKSWIKSRSSREASSNSDHTAVRIQGSERPPPPTLDRWKRIPAALILVVIGIIIVFIHDPSIAKTLKLGPSKPETVVPTWPEFKRGFWKAGLPQLPLTTLNSVIAVCQLSEDLFPDRPANPTGVATSVGAMNLIGAWFGVMPCCHGAGGLAAQTKFGATTGGAPVLLGIMKIVLGLLFGSSLLSIIQEFPEPLLGAMLVFSGVELACSCRSENEIRGVTLMIVTATGSFATGNTGIGFLIGASAFASISIYDFLQDLFS